MTGRVNIAVGYGKTVFPDSTTVLSALRVSAPFLRDSASTSGRREGPGGAHEVSRHGSMHGTLYSANISHEPGTVILLTATRSIRGVKASEGAILLRLRSGAAMLEVTGLLPNARENDFGSRFRMFSGHADILSVQEASVLGIHVPARFVECYFDPDQIAERFDVAELAAETVPRPEYVVMTSPDGIVVREVTAKPHRRITIRR